MKSDKIKALLEDFAENGLKGKLVQRFANANANKDKLPNVAKLDDEDYYAKCLNCGGIVLCGPRCCDNFKSQYRVDLEEGKK